MKTQILDIYKSEHLKSAVESVNCGEPIFFPTDTVFGLGADIYNVEACMEIFKIKSRDAGKPLSAHVSSIEMAIKLIDKPSELFIKVSEMFLPGALAIIVPKNSSVSDEITSGFKSISIRYPDNDICLKLIDAIGKPLAATSANISGEKSMTNAQDILSAFNNSIHYIVEGDCTHNTESTIISLVDAPKIIRLGVISKEELEDRLSIKFA